MRTVFFGIALSVTASGALGQSPASASQSPTAATVTIQSTVPTHPVRFTVFGMTSAVQVVADSLRSVGDSLMVVTPARLIVGGGAARVVVQAAPGEPWLAIHVSSADSTRLEACGAQLEFTRATPAAALTIQAPAMRYTKR